jgi:Flp pilus assembly protein TadD
MRWRVFLTAFLAWILTIPLTTGHAETTLQERYLNIYLKINDAEHLVQQGDYRNALADFQDCYTKLSKIHESDPNWESALVVHRMEDCRKMILDLQPRVDAMAPDQTPPAVATPTPTTNNPVIPLQTSPSTAPSDEVTGLRQELQAVKEELKITKDKLRDSQAMVETYRVQLETVNKQLAAVQNEQSVNQSMGKLLSENKALTTKLAAAQKEIDAFKTNPKSKLAMAQAQLKNLQDQYDASQAANNALSATTTSLKQQLDQAQADLVAANQKLAAAPAGGPEYETLKRENEIMRDILKRELQEQAHRDMAKRLAQEEFDNLKLKSKVLQENLDILGTPMTPPTNDQERELLASLRVPGPDVEAAPTNPANGFSASVTGAPSTDTNSAVVTVPGSTGTDTNSVSSTPAATNTASNTTPPATDSTTNPASTNVASNPASDSSTNATTSTPAATNVVSGNPDTNSTNAANPASGTNSVANVNPPPTPDNSAAAVTNASATNVPPTNAPATNVADTTPIPPNPPVGPSVSATNSTIATPPDPTTNTPPTTTQLPPATTTVTTTTVQNGDNAPKQADATQYSTKARLPDDMRDTAQEAADLFKNQRYDDSAAKYQSIIDKYPESLYAWSNLGVVRFQQGKFNEALKALQQAVKLSPTDAFSYSNLGIVYYQLGQFENAIDALNSAKALDPNDAKTHNYLGCACSQKGWQEVAEKEFRKAIEIDPDFGDAHFNLALVYATSKPPSIELARREYNRALELGIAKDPRLEKLLAAPQ